jgi:hypothetical protein
MAREHNDPIRHQSEHESRRRFEADAVGRLSNVLPVDAARNEGRFYGQLVRGGRPLSGVQRVGFFLTGLMFILWSIFITIGMFPRFFRYVGLPVAQMADKSVSIAYFPIAVLALFLGLKIFGTALRRRMRGKS